MVFPRTKVTIIDNSPIKSARCIKVFGFKKHRAGKIGQVFKASTHAMTANPKKLNLKPLNNFLLVTSRRKHQNRSGISCSFDNSEAILLDNSNQPLASKIPRPISKNLRGKNQAKLMAIAATLI